MAFATYSLGQKFTVRSHIPPPPTPVTYGSCLNRKPEKEEQNRRGALQTCLDFPPLPGNDGSFDVELEIAGLLRVKDNCNAQILVVRVCGATPKGPGLLPGERFIAKVFDPLFVKTERGEVNPIRLMDKHYTHEVATYQMLCEFQGTKIPKFYGSFSWSVPVPEQEGRFRKVRLILLEHLPGISMEEANAKRFSIQTQKNMIKKIIDFETDIYARGIELTDLSPRNVMMTDPTNPTKLHFLDFGDALFFDREKENISPLSRWADGDLVTPFGYDWINDWDCEYEYWFETQLAETTTTESQKIHQEHQHLGPRRELQDITNLSSVEPDTKSTQMPLR
jgi:serine/threonine protein kinase